jgi:hypothetical protein
MANPYLQYLWRCSVGFLLGVLSFLPVFAAGEGAGIVAGLIVAVVYFLVCQFLLSLRKENDLFYNRVVGSNTPVIVAMDLPLVIGFLIMLYGERRGPILSQGLPLLLLGCSSTFAGAALALSVARRRVCHGKGEQS